jgi:hypothetical protein
MSEDEARRAGNEEPADEVEGHARRIAANEEPEKEKEGDDGDDVEAHGRRMV